MIFPSLMDLDWPLQIFDRFLFLSDSSSDSLNSLIEKGFIPMLVFPTAFDCSLLVSEKRFLLYCCSVYMQVSQVTCSFLLI